jgi:hypothetical protein
MQQSIWLFVGALATLTTLGTVWAASVDDVLMIVGGVLGFVLWGVWSYGSLNVERVTGNGCCVVSWSSPAVTLVGVMLALIPAWFALTGGPDLFRKYRDPDAEEI